ncbi:MAG: GNAT family N-acetyltransferase, partial [Pseudomonadota bacterium]
MAVLRDSDGTVMRRLGEADLARCLERTAEAGWNQTANDWRLVFEIGEAVGLFRGEGLAATAAIVPHADGVGWICKVLTAQAERRKGHATRLMGWAVSRISELGRIAGLDATPLGAAVYGRLGFTTTQTLTRLGAQSVRPAPFPEAGAIRPLTADNLDDVRAYDCVRFGGDRSVLLRALLARRPDLGRVAWQGDAVAGFVLGRDGSKASHIGPVVANDDAVAMALIAGVAAGTGPTIINVMDARTNVRHWLVASGFAVQRPFLRMLRGCPAET